ncbi:oxidoreductase [Aureococcus anophagefferens]|nr:oxidoreductase [Aureococcus anophagefferens]
MEESSGARGAASDAPAVDEEVGEREPSLLVMSHNPIKPPPPPGAPPRPAAPAAAPAAASGRFDGERPQQFALWAHNMARVAAAALVVLGVFGVLWTSSGTYACKVRDRAINGKLIRRGAVVGGVNGTCVVGAGADGGGVAYRAACCDPDGPARAENLGGSPRRPRLRLRRPAGPRPGAGAPGLRALDADGLGLLPAARRAQGLLLGAVGGFACTTRSTSLAGFLALVAAACYELAFLRREAGDGGRARSAKAGRKPAHLREDDDAFSWRARLALLCSSSNFATTFWVGLYFGANALMFAHTLAIWVEAIRETERGLLRDDLKLDGCDACPAAGSKPYTRWRDACDLNKAALRNGPLSYFAPFAKAAGCAAGVALNFNCALLVLPVTRSVLILLNGLGGNYRAAQERSALFKKYFESPFARYVPLAKNVEFHKLVAWTMLALSLVHTVAHFFNYWASPRYTVARFAKWGWGGTSFVTGALVRGNAPFLVARVEWIPPVLAVHFRPADKRDFDFAEGTYVLLNCPFVSRHEWHPFTISSARGDLAAGARVALDDGETVVAVDPPAALPLRSRARWRRYRRASADPATVCDDDLLAAHETAHHDFVSCHIKVHAAAPGEPPTWTQALKDYLEMMAPRRDYPFHFTRRDDRGELLLGRARARTSGRS